MAYDETNRGALFKNDKKEKDSQPDYRGNINVNGVDYWLSAWLKEAESGRRYMSVSVQPKEQQHQAPQQQRQQAPRTHGDRPGGPNNRPQTAFDDMDSDVPF